MTDNYIAGEYSNRLLDSLESVIAAADPADPVDDLALTYLNAVYPTSQIASTADHLDAANSYAVDAQRLHSDPVYANKLHAVFCRLPAVAR
jgi:hypothetical protein